MYPTDEEIVEISEYFAEKLNKTKGPTAFLIPMQGWSAYDQPEERACIENGWAKGNGDGPQWEPDAKNPHWSKRSTMMRDILREKFDPNNENLDLLCIDYNVNDPEFATICETIMDSMLAGEWHKGMFRELEGVIE